MSSEKLAQRSYYGKGLATLAETHPNVVVFDADLAGSTKTSSFQKVAPERFIQTGIAEANMIGVAAGMAASGKVVFASTFGVFASGRCWEQIRMAVAYPKLNVKVVATHCGLSVGPDGATHQALEDIAIMRALPNMTVVVPCDAYEAYAATLAIADHPGPVYMRMGRSEFPVIKDKDCTFTVGKADVLREGSDITLVACGQMVQTSMGAASILEKDGISAEVVNMSTIKPLDTEVLLKSVKKTGAVITVEEHSIVGGLGSAVAECLVESCPVPQGRVGTNDTFGESGEAEELLVKYGLTAKDIVAKAKETLKRKR